MKDKADVIDLSDSPVGGGGGVGVRLSSKRRRTSSTDNQEVVDLTDFTSPVPHSDGATVATVKRGGEGSGGRGRDGILGERRNTENVRSSGREGGGGCASGPGGSSRGGGAGGGRGGSSRVEEAGIARGASASAVDEDEAFARRLQEEENKTWQEERAAVQRRAADWRRHQDAIEAAAAEHDDDGENDDEDDDEDDDDEGGADLLDALGQRMRVDGGEGGNGWGARGGGRGGGGGRGRHPPGHPGGPGHGHGHGHGAGAAARRMHMLELQQFMGALTQHIHAAGSNPADRANLASLVMSDRDFNEDDYERLLALDNTAVRRGMSATALSRIPVSKWAGRSGSGSGAAKNANGTEAAGGRDEGGGGDCDHARCAVCLENYEKGDSVRHLPCLHSYHSKCIDKWFEASVECPVCKHDVNELME